MNSNKYKTIVFWVLMAVLLVTILFFHESKQAPPTKITYAEFLDYVRNGQVTEITLQANESGGINTGVTIKGELSGNKPFETFTTDPDIHTILKENNVQYAEKPYSPRLFQTILIQILPFALIILLIWYFAYRQMQSGGNKALSFGKSRARLHQQSQSKVNFDDVAGVEEAKQELQEIIEFLKDPKKFTRLGGKIPKGVLLVGPPGSGKTLLARAVAGEAKVPFFSISGSDFVEMFVGVGAARVRDLFATGMKHAPCIIFIDELDAVGRQRGAGLGGGHDEREQTLNQLLVEMDGFNSNEGVILMAATNRPDVLDKALLRPGRFDRSIVVDNPDIFGREGILKVHTRNIPIDPSVNLKVLARGTPGFSGADLANMVNEAALLAARRSKDRVDMHDFDEAKDRVLMGPERKSMFISDEEKKTTAYHEAGHALVGYLLPGTDPLHKVTIIPRGQALGLTQHLPLEDRHTYSRSYILNLITMMMGGRAAEELILKDITNGAGNDIRNATHLARRMVCEWGMSDKLGPVSFGENDEVFLGRDILKERNFSEEIAAAIDKEVRTVVETCHERATTLLLENREKLEKLAHKLIELEVIEGSQLEKILNE
ncbi:MAG: ATP-dependent metallopeptidase FtsH/Yme1/Tma family protein [Candidatus Abyssobacteria bacterium SURF_5]|uniref:ATP-dependent zinc metalloprotease FtsH n=1 Tax=Abyssobacteria bacterium (strain SURF_5) TaxID=2093360 RepID=A0A3A4P0K3_ABYX5|nr:MAG: ATP-dependent metallopeptidase FtsH/Yme1/Tma family protein [Candidatus Abyssubacteria bacterium SURF_5]